MHVHTIGGMVDRMADRSVVRQVADELRAEITAGRLAPGEPLPSENAIVQRYGVARSTARAAVAILRAEGLVVTYSGRGSFVRQAAEPELVDVTPGATVAARQPSDDERRRLALAEGVPLLVVSRPGAADEVFPADRVRLAVVEGKRRG